jgi:hypothetical protein
MNKTPIHRRAITHFLKEGCTMSVFDEMEWAVTDSTNRKEIYEAVHSVENPEVRMVDKNGVYFATISIIWGWGMADDETIADWSYPEGNDTFGDWWKKAVRDYE